MADDIAPALVFAVAVPGAGAADRLAGLSLALRAVLTVQGAGADRITLVLDPADEALGQSIRKDRRLRVPFELVLVSSGAVAAARSITALPTLVARHDCIASPSVYKALLASRPTIEGALEGLTTRADDGATGPFLATPELFAALGNEPLDEGLERLRALGSVRTLETPGWRVRVNSEAGRSRAITQLFEDCRKPLDGIVSRRLNRHISIFLSKRLVDTPITPNMATVIALSFGVAGAAIAARGGYLPTLVGATLFQINSVVDGVDGELARVRFQHSRLGQWLDTVFDDVANVLFWSGLAVGARILPAGTWLSACGWVAAGTNVVAAGLSYVELLRVGSGDWYALGWDVRDRQRRSLLDRIVTLAGYFLKKDFFIFFCMCLAALGILSYMTPVLAVGGTVTMISTIVRLLRRAKPEARPPRPELGAKAPSSAPR